jgi:hypothetical protein
MATNGDSMGKTSCSFSTGCDKRHEQRNDPNSSIALNFEIYPIPSDWVNPFVDVSGLLEFARDYSNWKTPIGSASLSGHGVNHVPGSQHELAETDETYLAKPRAVDPHALTWKSVKPMPSAAMCGRAFTSSRSTVASSK